ncbi:hypothetical protein ROHU_011629 [Labeo rohita]|uniref:Uncharacterized protein n=1 Tax=Labeo rohita TaxID=84645 RepID=A0A498LIM5_LABRO|nr:hypothetical protein ROHU_011629 [Labeo rohita]
MEHYKRRWNLRINGLLEKSDEDPHREVCGLIVDSLLYYQWSVSVMRYVTFEKNLAVRSGVYGKNSMSSSGSNQLVSNNILLRYGAQKSAV